MRIRPFKALRPEPDQAAGVSAPPYDVVTREQARAILRDEPQSFLGITRPDAALADDVPPDDPRVYDEARKAFRRLQDDGYLKAAPDEALYLYRQRLGDHEQTGLVALCSTDDYDQGLIRKHEKTRAKPEADRTRHMQAVGAHTGLVFLAYRERPDLTRTVETAMQAEPYCAFVSADGVEHTIWTLPGNHALAEGFSDVPRVYIADGHHRAAASARVARERADADPDSPSRWFPVALFPDSQLNILAYNRVISELNGLSPEAFLDRLRAICDVQADVGDRPHAPRHLSLYLNGTWYGLAWTVPPDSDPVSALDASFLQNRILSPVLGIDDPRADPRIDFVGGIHGPGELVRRVDAGEAVAAFSMFPTTMDELLQVADAGLDMPPKSTWFEPKLRSGLFVHVFETR